MILVKVLVAAIITVVFLGVVIAVTRALAKGDKEDEE